MVRRTAVTSNNTTMHKFQQHRKQNKKIVRHVCCKFPVFILFHSIHHHIIFVCCFASLPRVTVQTKTLGHATKIVARASIAGGVPGKVRQLPMAFRRRHCPITSVEDWGANAYSVGEATSCFCSAVFYKINCWLLSFDLKYIN